MRVLSMDPGTPNFGVAVIDIGVKDDQMKVKLVGTAMLRTFIKDPATISQHRAFRAAAWSLEHFYGPFDIVCAERFQSRGLKGKTIESINMMLGILSDIYPNIQLYTASTWKNAFNRVTDLNAAYEDLKQKNAVIKKSLRTHQIHELDASLMGQYCAAKQLNLPPFVHLKDREGIYVNHFMKSLKLTQKV